MICLAFCSSYGFTHEMRKCGLGAVYWLSAGQVVPRPVHVADRLALV
jgi:hypothetical protein